MLPTCLPLNFAWIALHRVPRALSYQDLETHRLHMLPTCVPFVFTCRPVPTPHLCSHLRTLHHIDCARPLQARLSSWSVLPPQHALLCFVPYQDTSPELRMNSTVLLFDKFCTAMPNPLQADTACPRMQKHFLTSCVGQGFSRLLLRPDSACPMKNMQL